MTEEFPTYETLPDASEARCYERWFTSLYVPDWALRHPLARRELGGYALVVPPHPHIGGNDGRETA